MKALDLDPPPSHKISFKANQHLRVPAQRGCYILSSIDETILYVGLSKDLMRRFNEHLDTPDKTVPTPFGRAIWFHWLLYENIEKLERTWLNTHEVAEGRLPFFNVLRSPVSI